MNKSNLNKEVYNERYYSMARRASEDISHNRGLRIFKEIAKNKSKILECGCGEGTKLNLISEHSGEVYGDDYSLEAIKIARKTYPSIKFKMGSIERLSYKGSTFDFVYTAFVLEHTTNPEIIIKEMIRVTKKGGYIGIICPNFGSFCYRSPCSKENLLLRSLKIIFRDIFIVFLNKNRLYWHRVEPIATSDTFEPDWDTTIEPSLITTMNFLSNHRNLKVVDASSLWELYNQCEPKMKYGKTIIKIVTHMCFILGKLKLYPFKYWGPLQFILVRKI